MDAATKALSTYTYTATGLTEKLLFPDAWLNYSIAATETKKAGVNDPDFVVFKTNGAGSQGVFTEFFDPATEEELYFIMPLPNSWIPESDIKATVKWIPASTGNANEFVKWGLEYTWQNIDGIYSNTTIITSDASSAITATTSGDSVMNIDKHYITYIDTISGTGITNNSVLFGRIFRDATDSTDDYTDDAGLVSINFNMQVDTMGSAEEYQKYGG
jgi:hypothetical protein